MAVFDTHAHIISPDLRHYPRAPIGGHASDWSQTRPVDVDAMLAAMDAAGVTRTVLVQASTCYGHDNSYVANAVAAHPDRFTGVCSVDVLESDAPLVLRHWLESRVTGLRIFTTGSNLGGQQLEILDDPRFLSRCGRPPAQGGCPSILFADDGKRRCRRSRCWRSALSARAHPARSFRPARSRRRPALCARRRALGAGASSLERLFPRRARIRLPRQTSGQATPASFFRRAIDEFGAVRICWGSNFPAAEGTLAELLKRWRAKTLTRGRLGERSGLGLCQDRAFALSSAQSLKRKLEESYRGRSPMKLSLMTWQLVRTPSR